MYVRRAPPPRAKTISSGQRAHLCMMAAAITWIYAGVVGDISPQYWEFLDEEGIRMTKELLPDLKIILLLRDPVERI
jgi:hypothetical protein